MLMRIAATIICYHPQLASVARLVHRIADEVEIIIIHNNGGAKSSELKALHTKVIISCTQTNSGIAIPLNRAIRLAIKLHCQYFVAFDQDSTPKSGMLTELKSVLTGYQKINKKAIAIGPTLIDKRDKKNKVYAFPNSSDQYRCKESQEVSEVSHLITSGCLIDLSKWESRFNFREELFIDLIDTQWCWNIASAGYIILGAKNIEMLHELSDEIIDLNFFSLTRYSPVRRYYQIRNALSIYRSDHLTRTQQYFLLKGVILNLFSAAFTDRSRLSSIRHCVRGLIHAFKNRLGQID